MQRKIIALAIKMTDAEKRLLKIKTGSVVRLKKELGLYEKEQEQERQKVARMKEEGADSHDIKHAVSLLISKSHIVVQERHIVALQNDFVC